MKKYCSKQEILELFINLNVKYINDYIYEYSVDNINFYNSDYYLSNIDEFEALKDIYQDYIMNNILEDVYIKKTLNKGYGLFANRDIKKDSFIGVYLGIVREQDEYVLYDEKGYDTDYAWDYPDEINVNTILEINGKYAGNELRFVNHDNNPNLRIEHTIINNKWYIFFISDIDLKKDDELTIYYGDAYWDTDYRTLS